MIQLTTRRTDGGLRGHVWDWIRETSTLAFQLMPPLVDVQARIELPLAQ
jgi:hypothetical protein